MQILDVKATVRKDAGKKATRDIRRADAVPAVLYGEQKDAEGKQVSTLLTVTNDALRNLVYTPNIYQVNLDIDGKPVKAILKDIQFHPVTDAILHVDFYQIAEKTPVVIAVPVSLNGLAEGVRAGGKLQLVLRKIKVKGLYNNIPDRLDVDVTPLGLGKTIKVSDLSFPNIELISAKEAVVCAVKLTRAARGAAAAAANE